MDYSDLLKSKSKRQYTSDQDFSKQVPNTRGGSIERSHPAIDPNKPIQLNGKHPAIDSNKPYDIGNKLMSGDSKVPAGKMVNTPFGGAMMRSGHELDEGSKRMQSLSKVSKGYAKTMITNKKTEWTKFMTDMPKGYRTKEEISAKRKELSAKK